MVFIMMYLTNLLFFILLKNLYVSASVWGFTYSPILEISELLSHLIINFCQFPFYFLLVEPNDMDVGFTTISHKSCPERSVEVNSNFN